MKPEDLLEHATEFAFYPDGADRNDINAHYHRITVAERSPGKWAVIHNFRCWDGKEWDFESSPSSRTKSFLKKTRFPLDKAVEIARSQVNLAKVNGSTYAEWQERLVEIKAHEERLAEDKRNREA